MATAFPLHELGTLSALSSTAAGSLLASVWQGVLLVAWVGTCLLLLRGLSAAVRSVVWTVALLLVTLLPVFAFWRRSNPGNLLAHTPSLHIDARWSFAIAVAWAALSLFRLGQLAVSARRLRSLGRNAVAVQPGPAIRALLSGARSAELCASEEVDRPSVAGFFHPRVLLPPDLLSRLPEAELAQIVLHEMEHLRRRDDWTNLVQKLALAVLPLNPVLFWLDRRLCLERELACDDGVLRAADQFSARKAYAARLTKLAEESMVGRGVSLALGAVGTWKPQSEVGRRVLRILRRPEVAMGRTQTRFAAGALLAATLAGALLLGRSPALVSFVSPDPPVMAQASPLPSAPAIGGMSAKVIPMAAFEGSGPRPRLVNATMPVGSMRPVVPMRAPSRKAASGKARTHVSAVQRLARVRSGEARQHAPWEVLTSWGMDSPLAGPSLLLLQDAHFRYAAVPVRDGWLIVQL